MTLRLFFGHAPALAFEDAVETLRGNDVAASQRALERIDESLRAGYHVAGYIAYDFGPTVLGLQRPSPSLPLLHLGIFRSPQKLALNTRSESFRLGPPLSRIPVEWYARCVDRVQAAILDGEVYQLNLTVPFDVPFDGDPLDLYAHLASRSQAPYAAFAQSDDVVLISLSPECFLQFDGTNVETKPMKGTAAPGRELELQSAKNRAEHVMIVDLLRNDLQRTCEDVTVRDAFSLERYPTFSTMTSTVAGRMREDVSTGDVFRTAFPCGSVTGAPKRAAMGLIAQIEGEPRGCYTGAIGYLAPQRRGWWSVAIRTLQRASGSSLRLDAGGGIVADSTAEDEWAEIGVKLRFLRDAAQAVEILETFSLGGDIEAHLRRLASTAARLHYVIDLVKLRAALAALPAGDPARIVRVRVRVNGTFTLRVDPFVQALGNVRICFSRARVRSDDPMLRVKTSWRPAHDLAAQEAAGQNCFDALLSNERGELSEGARTNLFVRRDGRLLTPAGNAGLLPGILRERLISQGVAIEGTVYPDDLSQPGEVYVGNSARGLLRAEVIRERIGV